MTKLIRAAILALLGAAAAVPAAAQSQNRVEAIRDWSIFVAQQNGGKVCWIVSKPQKSVALRGGKQVTVNRGDIYLMVAIRPAESVSGEVSFIAGYPFKKGSTVELRIGSNKHQLFTDGENAWPDPTEDASLISGFRAGADAVLEGVSSRGTTTVDTFSLLGFTAALESAQKRCG